MRVSLQWLRELVACDLPPADLAERLSVAGFEVEEIEDLAARAAGVVVGFVAAREQHPNADKLSVCTVAIGAAEPLQIVCGASNVRAGIHVAVATVGTYLPAVDLTIKPAELRGVASSGMICSLAELGLASDSEGIVILDEALESVPALGTPVGPSLGLDDQVLELAITANRPDGLSMLGIAREVAALTASPLTLPAAAPPVAAEPLPAEPGTQAAIEAGGLFSVTALSGLRVGPSPRWLQTRLERAGLRPINTIVDVTNLVMLETGQPLHAFDRDRLASLSEAASGGTAAQPSALGLRQARAGEAFAALDGTGHSLSPDALVVTVADQPVALAGVIGGANSSVQEGTTAIWLEAALFAPQAVRRSARSVGLRTDASSRFEKGLPREVTLAAADRAVALLQELAGATVEGRWLHQRPELPRQPLRLERDALHQLLGPVDLGDEDFGDLPDTEVEQILSALGCGLTADDDGWDVVVPPSRAMDLTRPVDLIEEVARLVGYDRFASHLPDPIAPGGLSPEQQAERRLRVALVQAGLQETCSLSLTAASSSLQRQDPAATQRIPLANPLLADYGHLRSDLVEELLLAARRNLQAGRPGFWAFEIGHVFQASGKGERQRLQLAGVICGSRGSELWSSGGKPQAPDYFRARGVLQRALEALKLPMEDRRLSDHPLLHPGRAAQLVVEGRPAGWFGQLHPEQAEALDLPALTHVFQLELPALLTAATRRNRWQPAFAPFPTVPASERDLALVVPDAVASAQLLTAIRKAGKPLLEQAELIDRYAGEQVAAGSCSLAFRLRYRAPSRTLTDSEVDTAHQTIRAALEKQFDAQLRA
ncbi:phenylalanine--tRNA ligase subunit beta [Vulcanococcus limneticus]|uniref:phenylalanine--tRNA ligase subunit beta n=1 Tax=Vulcanococcus limneticus TaxID=2170428 RepID=UPI00398BD642